MDMNDVVPEGNITDILLISTIEEDTSLALAVQRQQQQRQLLDPDDDSNSNWRRQLKKKKHSGKHGGPPLPARGDTQHGMMIDAGSQGTRIHVYEYDARILKHRHEVSLAARGLKLSFPTTDSRWTDRLKPGLDAFAYIADADDMTDQVREYLLPLFEFAKTILEEKKHSWNSYPVYLKATGGLRTLPRPYRIRLIGVVRKIMHDTKFNPFYFEDEYVIRMLQK
jgi:GDA1/CD39 (nucleoside phosphatase) family